MQILSAGGAPSRIGEAQKDKKESTHIDGLNIGRWQTDVRLAVRAEVAAVSTSNQTWKEMESNLRLEISAVALEVGNGE